MPDMSEWVIALVAALIAACSAVAGSLVTGRYSRSAGLIQAQAARHAGDRQADAMLETVRLTLRQEYAVHGLDTRRQAYVRFLDAAETAMAAEHNGQGRPEARAAFQRANAEVTLEGPEELVAAARTIADLLRHHGRPDELESAKQGFISAAQRALQATAVIVSP